MPKRILIIQPPHYRSRSDPTLRKSRERTLVPLTLPYLAALTPPGWEIRLIDEQLTDIDFQAPVDLAAITAWTLNPFRAFEIADRFRERKVPVIIGGPHARFHLEETAEHCDAVGVGEGEQIWPVMLEDAACGRPRRFTTPIPRLSLKDCPCSSPRPISPLG